MPKCLRLQNNTLCPFNRLTRCERNANGQQTKQLNTMNKGLFYTLVLICLALLATSCAPKKHGCKGLKAHPNYSKNWKH